MSWLDGLPPRLAALYDGSRTRTPLVDRILAGVMLTERGCTEWQGAKDKDGYGRIGVGGGRRSAQRVHIVSYLLFVGDIPDGMELDHLCRNPPCCNPSHLEAVPQRVNILRGEGIAAINAAKTHCPQGHEYSGGNLRITSQGWRVCRICSREKNRRHRARQ